MILRRIFNHVRLDDVHINLAERNNLIKLNSLVHSQIKSKARSSEMPMVRINGYIRMAQKWIFKRLNSKTHRCTVGNEGADSFNTFTIFV